jgi:hypothetical protein
MSEKMGKDFFAPRHCTSMVFDSIKYHAVQGRPQDILQGGVRSFQPTDERAWTDNMLAMEACKISDGGQLNSGTAEPCICGLRGL